MKYQFQERSLSKMKNIRAVLFLVPFLFLSLVAAADKDAMEKLVQVDKEIAELQARINAI